MLRLRISTALVLTATIAEAQEPGAAPPDSAKPPSIKRSLADGLVRQCIERHSLAVPAMRSGLEMAHGKGPMVLLVRRSNGTFDLQAMPRGRGDHGPAAELQKAKLQAPEEIVNENKPLPMPRARRKGAPTKLSVRCDDDLATVQVLQPSKADGSSTPEEQLHGKQVDRDKLQQQLRRCLLAARQTQAAAQLLLELDANARMQDVLTCWEIARDVGFQTVMFSPKGRQRAATEAEREMIGGLPKRFSWPKRRGAGVPLCDGELLILLDGPTRVRDVLPLILLCANTGIWQIAFAGQEPGKEQDPAKEPQRSKSRRFKLPTHLPADQG